MTIKTTYAVDYVLCGLPLTAVTESWDDVVEFAGVYAIRKNTFFYVNGKFDGVHTEVIV